MRYICIAFNIPRKVDMAARKAKMRTDALSAIKDPGINIYLKKIAHNAPLSGKERKRIIRAYPAGG